TMIAATIVDVNDVQAKRIVLADNRTSDLGDFVEKSLANVLEGLPDLNGSGYDARDLDRLLSRLAHVETFHDPLEAVAGHVRLATDVASPVITVGQITMYTDAESFRQWVANVKDPQEIPLRLQWKESAPPVKDTLDQMKEKSINVTADEIEMDDGVDVALKELKPLDANYRIHATTVVVESLKVNGQFRPIVVNKRDNTIVVGQAVADAAKVLGWESLKVTYIDVDHDTAVKISLVDNSSADLAWYDTKALARMLMSVEDIIGTGFDAKSVEKIVDEAGMLVQEAIEAPMVTVRIRYRPDGIDWVWISSRADFDEWNTGITREGRYSDEGVRSAIAARLGFPYDKLTKSQHR